MPKAPPNRSASQAPTVVLNLSGSPYHHGKRHFRERMFATRASDNAVIVAHCNLVGGQDELVFDGNSMVFDHEGELIAHAPAFEEHSSSSTSTSNRLRLGRLHVPLRRYPGLQQYARPVDEDFVSGPSRPPNPRSPCHQRRAPGPRGRGLQRAGHRHPRLRPQERLRDRHVGMSGGIDSSLVATIAADALGPSTSSASPTPRATRPRAQSPTPRHSQTISASS